MQPKHFTVCAAFFAASTGAAAAPQATFVQANSLRQLPLAVQQQLGVGNGDDAIADSGERFNGGCVGGSGVPRKRFLLGAVSSDVVVVAIEVGGIALYSRTLEWRRQGDAWVKSERRNALPFPKNLQELLAEGQPAGLQRAALLLD
ncbi:hypothetical protein [Massilia sp. PWRC2]|uniref:hypothetical protein n=1 Tax=Massilia sp. PWRC2 TaxID=2804626 RepID=UPI003CF5ADF0